MSRIYLHNLVCILSMSGPIWYPHISELYDRTELTRQSNNLNCSGTFKRMFDNILYRLCNAQKCTFVFESNFHFYKK